MWNWTQPISVRMMPKPVGTTAPAKAEEQAALLTKPVEVPSHPPKSEDTEQ